MLFLFRYFNQKQKKVKLYFEVMMNRMQKMSSFIVMDILKKARQYKNAIHFEVGQPDILPSPKIREALKKAVDEGHFHYTEAFGLLALREKIAQFYFKNYGTKIDPARIILTPGTSGAFLVAYSILVNYNGKILFTDPGYPCYKNFSHLLNINPIHVAVDSTTNYQLTVEYLKKYSDIKAVQISSPANPTGTLYSKDNLKELVLYCKQKSMAFISDEIYHGLVYSSQQHTALEFSDDVIVINGFSKYFCAPGLRLGWMIIPEKLIRDAEKVMQNIFICAPSISQYGALEAFDEAYLNHVKNIYEKRRDFLYENLKELFEIDVKPEGAFYLWANIKKYSNNSYEFAHKLLEKTRVAVTPGVDFGQNRTNEYIRFAYTIEIEHMQEGINRLKNYLI